VNERSMCVLYYTDVHDTRGVFSLYEDMHTFELHCRAFMSHWDITVYSLQKTRLYHWSSADQTVSVPSKLRGKTLFSELCRTPKSPDSLWPSETNHRHIVQMLYC